MDSSKVSTVRKEAEDLFNHGRCCAESVLLALANAQGINSDLIPKIATGFCGGMARTGCQCGAISGAMMGIDLVLGRAQPDTSNQDCYEAIQRLIREFEAEFGSRYCYELLGCDLNTPEGHAAYQARGLKVQCTVYTGKAAEIAAQIITESSTQGA
ncbi:MAG TPA: C-GCAxxG-C-C family protein [Longilinea sp.]|nr:C-GCAxxG-C-C family protein [Longilinea sp.]